MKDGKTTADFIKTRFEAESKAGEIVKQLRATGKLDTEIIERQILDCYRGLETDSKEFKSIMFLAYMAYDYYHKLYMATK